MCNKYSVLRQLRSTFPRRSKKSKNQPTSSERHSPRLRILNHIPEFRRSTSFLSKAELLYFSGALHHRNITSFSLARVTSSIFLSLSTDKNIVQRAPVEEKGSFCAPRFQSAGRFAFLSGEFRSNHSLSRPSSFNFLPEFLVPRKRRKKNSTIGLCVCFLRLLPSRIAI